MFSLRMHGLAFACMVGCSPFSHSIDLSGEGRDGRRDTGSSLILTEVLDHPSTGLKAVEICNRGGSPLSLGNVRLERFANGQVQGSGVGLPAVVLAPGEAFVAVQNGGTSLFQETIGGSPDFESSVVSGNGDDVYQLVEGGLVLDRFGEVGVDGTGEPWEYKDSTAARRESVATGSSVWSASEWVFGEASTLGDCGGSRGPHEPVEPRPEPEDCFEAGTCFEACVTEGLDADTEGLVGADLVAVLSDYADPQWCSWNNSRRELFGRIDAIDGEVRGIYTGWTEDARFDTTAGRLNTEHAWPQSLGAGSGRARCDLHHLYAAHEVANSVRGSLAFGEPVFDIDWTWGESRRGRNADGERVFEPPASYKGDIARSLLYMHVTYGLFLDEDYASLLQGWHTLDPPDAMELDRTLLIAGEQGRVNPLVVCPQLVERL